MNHFCTLFNSDYFSRGLAMYRSLAATGEDFTLYVYCMDDRVCRILRAMALPGVVPVSLAEFETAALLGVKEDRTVGEYCWTCTPHVIRHALDTFRLAAITYVDADTFFYRPPSLLLEELERSGGSILLTEHRFSSGYEGGIVKGRYCVQFMTLKADERGNAALDWWGDRCLEWCYSHMEEGKFGDQKYLDDWTERFAGTHVLEHPGGGVAPWNIGRYELLSGDDNLCFMEKETHRRFELVFYHFHFLRWYLNGFLDFGHYPLPETVKNMLYRPYLAALEEAGAEIAAVDGSFDPHGITSPAEGVRELLIRLKRLFTGSYIRYQAFRRG
jgi:hypothetical protein